MQQAIDISWPLLLLFSFTLLIPIGIGTHYRLGINKDILIGALRMTLQLLCVGVYLEYLFTTDNMWLNLLWVALMIAIGASAILDKAKVPKTLLFIPVSIGLLLGLAPMILLLCWVVVKPTPMFGAQYVIPLCGMLLGNSLSGNIVALQNLFSAFEQRKPEYEAAISLGASIDFATLPFVRDAMQKALAPILASMATTGLVTLPGMMTGQILGGTSPLIAIKYQLVIMIAILVMMSLSIMTALRLSIRKAITPEGRVKVSLKPQ
ncbi:ABC transporter permease [Vibrio sp. SCSIO 43136]|uniref:ABC transporter permease n=1 Tax=Vibrio sp. SCSIO 43136 TaxID=2819101 RepID=UPI0020756974|nr:ABC transporter permease [Vibrio sp. SCSIO 43136]USD66279.1 ABC transporter permease [Vibrio sp. SCSIO 43136]